MHHALRRGPAAPIALALAAALTPRISPAATVVGFDFDDAALQFENAPAFVAPDLGASAWTDLDGTLTNLGGNPGKALGAKSFNDGNTLQFTLTIAPGQALYLDGFGFDAQVSASGPKLWTLAIAGDAIASGTTATSFQSNGGNFAERRYTGPIEVALHGEGATSTSGTFRVDNFALSGRVAAVPVPAAAWLALVPGASLLRRRRSR
ncbi:MAG: hypothetical protein HY943_21890 [Gammaproteobacteria bacterium]|nr:hypothetical protein [Gammaproteobacteria bacterium]